jgi:hypothetical protein
MQGGGKAEGPLRKPNFRLGPIASAIVTARHGAVWRRTLHLFSEVDLKMFPSGGHKPSIHSKQLSPLRSIIILFLEGDLEDERGQGIQDHPQREYQKDAEPVRWVLS